MKRAIISVSDKTGVVELAKALHALDFELLSTGGTHRAIAAAGIPVTGISDVTGFPECLDGRVKTLHPRIHAGILAMRDNPAHMQTLRELDIAPIDLVVINLYPFRATIEKPGVTFEEAIENIDIGGPTMLRAAAKNWQDVAVVIDPADYDALLSQLRETGEIARDFKAYLCRKVFAHTAQYDAMISGWLSKQAGDDPFAPTFTPTYEKAQEMRYGENPHQRAAFYRELGAHPGSLAEAEQLQGKELSYNNIADTDGALDLLREFDSTAVVAVKHGNPCGVGVDDSILTAYTLAHDADPVSIYGGIVVTNAQIDGATARKMGETFLEIVVAPSFTDGALKAFAKKKNLRVLKLDTRAKMPAGTLTMKKVYGGLLLQDYDAPLLPETPCRVVTKVQPTEQQRKDMMLAWRIVKHAKSNGIAVAKDNHSLGIGPGQVNRVWAVDMALARSGEAVRGAALASDAYFPFDDSVRACAKAGITCIIQPGGSIRDQDSIDACDELGLCMIFTDMRHFKH